ncbi:MAG TPA: hypothetical protein VF881_16025 [Polyangiaceae bacterium]
MFHELVTARQRDVVPYVIRHVGSVFSRWLFGQREAQGLPALLAMANERGWLDLWAALLRTGATKELFGSEVRRLVRSTLPVAEIRTKLVLIAGHGREANFPGISLAQVHPLDEDVAGELYRRFPDLVRGPYRMHVAPGWHSAYPKIVRAAIDTADVELVDYLASRAGIQVLSYWADSRGWKETLESLTSHFEALADQEFVRRASNALSRMPAFAVYDQDARDEAGRASAGHRRDREFGFGSLAPKAPAHSCDVAPCIEGARRSQAPRGAHRPARVGPYAESRSGHRFAKKGEVLIVPSPTARQCEKLRRRP